MSIQEEIDGLRKSNQIISQQIVEAYERDCEKVTTRLNEFVKERDEAFTEAVVNGHWNMVRKFAKKYYGENIPKDKLMKVGVYKAVQYCTDIPEEVKVLAMQKCLSLGFSPFIKPIEEGGAE